MRSVTQWGLQAWGSITALLAAQDASLPGLRRLAARANMYDVAKVSPAPLVSTAVTCGWDTGLSSTPAGTLCRQALGQRQKEEHRLLRQASTAEHAMRSLTQAVDTLAEHGGAACLSPHGLELGCKPLHSLTFSASRCCMPSAVTSSAPNSPRVTSQRADLEASRGTVSVLQVLVSTSDRKTDVRGPRAACRCSVSLT